MIRTLQWGGPVGWLEQGRALACHSNVRCHGSQGESGSKHCWYFVEALNVCRVLTVLPSKHSTTGLLRIMDSPLVYWTKRVMVTPNVLISLNDSDEKFCWWGFQFSVHFKLVVHFKSLVLRLEIVSFLTLEGFLMMSSSLQISINQYLINLLEAKHGTTKTATTMVCFLIFLSGNRTTSEHPAGVRKLLHQLHSPQQWQWLPQLSPPPVHPAHAPRSIPNELHCHPQQQHKQQQQQLQNSETAGCEVWRWRGKCWDCGPQRQLCDVCAETYLRRHGAAGKTWRSAGALPAVG